MVRGDESEEELQAMVERGIEPIKVVPIKAQGALFADAEEEVE